MFSLTVAVCVIVTVTRTAPSGTAAAGFIGGGGPLGIEVGGDEDGREVMGAVVKGIGVVVAEAVVSAVRAGMAFSFWKKGLLCRGRMALRRRSVRSVKEMIGTEVGC